MKEIHYNQFNVRLSDEIIRVPDENGELQPKRVVRLAFTPMTGNVPDGETLVFCIEPSVAAQIGRDMIKYDDNGIILPDPGVITH